MFDGKLSSINSNSFLTKSVTSIRFAEVCFNIPKPIISSAFPLNNCLVSSGPISIFETSPNFTKENPSPFLITKFLKSSTVLKPLSNFTV